MIQVESKLSLYGGIAMDERCEACGGELMEGKLAGMHGMQFYPAGEFEKLLIPMPLHRQNVSRPSLPVTLSHRQLKI